jgi:hypothetical protein
MLRLQRWGYFELICLSVELLIYLVLLNNDQFLISSKHNQEWLESLLEDMEDESTNDATTSNVSDTIVSSNAVSEMQGVIHPSSFIVIVLQYAQSVHFAKQSNSFTGSLLQTHGRFWCDLRSTSQLHLNNFTNRTLTQQRHNFKYHR